MWATTEATKNANDGINVRSCWIGYRHLVDPEQFGFTGEGARPAQQHQADSRLKNAVTAAV